MISQPIHFRKNQKDQSGFTLMEILLATIAISIILIVVQGLFSHAQKLRNRSTEHVRDARIRTRVAAMIREDLSNAIVTGNILASSISGNNQSSDSKYPGYLRFTSTRMDDLEHSQLAGDIQEVTYSIRTSAADDGHEGGELVRSVDRQLLASERQFEFEDTLLDHVQSMEITFFDGSNWTTEWDNSVTVTDIPQAIRIRIQQASTSNSEATPSPLEIMIPWTTQPLNEVTDTNSTDEASWTPGSCPTRSLVVIHEASPFYLDHSL